jgi:orotidine-5'-phosphate decarboxylase
VKAYFTASELIEAGRVRGLITDDEYRFCMTYFRVYGCPEVVEAYRDKIGPDVMTQPLFMPVRRSIIPACDFEDIVLFEALVAAVADVDGVGGFKVGSLLAERHGLEKLVGIVRNKAPNKAFIYDRQKGGTDIPDMVWKQVRQYGQIGCQAHIIFPSMTGVESMLAAIHSGYEHGVKIIMGAYMTHAGFDRAEGGCVTVEDASRLYAIAASKGIRNFVMPGTRPDLISLFRSQLKAQGAESVAVFSPGLITQQGSVSQAGQAAGENFGAIAGRAIYEKSPGAFKTPEEMRAAVLKLTAQL